MTLITTKDYRAAFDAYLRKGTPFRLAAKRLQPDAYYVWRTSGDEKVRPSHAENDGKVISWSHRPATGHPGEDFNRRCTAEPYLAELREFVDFALHAVEDHGAAWSGFDFVRHYFKGGGRAVTVRETGHLRQVVEYYGNVLGVFGDIKEQVVAAARGNIEQKFTYNFGNSYPLKGAVFSIGNTVIRGAFEGICRREGGYLGLDGAIEFQLSDAFVDPMSIGWVADPIEEAIGQIDRDANRFFQNLVDQELRQCIRTGKSYARAALLTKKISEPGTPYAITDKWRATVKGEFHADPQNSEFTYEIE